ncbi:sensor histidine kinase [Mesobaculum littorinae]|uniref:C4-dicarboxylate transport sensor protein DctB n=1 Tax=Mesobaculum littorinae TaxID=2486419 RepID=A0A438ALG1_9RHOB|nr:ATP-binding protein [Mesobaculum littorinae]RVV99490.1 sensor histidine kinase [Mesobaculum littorinae]
MSDDETEDSGDRAPVRAWRVRAAFVLLVTIAIAVVWVTNQLLTERFTENTRNRAQVRLALYSGNLMSELQRASIVPLLLSRDPALIGALNSAEYAQTSQRLISYLDEIGAASLMLIDRDGRTVAATDRARLGATHRTEAFFVEAMRSNDTVFSTVRQESGAFAFYYSRKITAGGELLGVIVVAVDLRQFEDSWGGFSDAVFVTNSEGQIILSTESRWRGRTETEALAVRSAPNAIQRALQATADWTALPPDAYLLGEAVMRQEARIAFQGWRMTSFTTYASVREKVNGVLALEIMAFALLLAGGFYLVTRKALARSIFFQRETAELRQLNVALQREIAEREKAEKSLQVAEQTVEQTSKLAALGEMSAAVSHELNQPLAAMKTYLAGAKLLLQRKRPEEALSSFQRIDDLIDRMGTITRQLKSYARKGGDAFERLDLRACVSSALAMMEPQLKGRDVAVSKTLPKMPLMVRADKVRVEQVIINLLRNAFDATKDEPRPEIEIFLLAGETAATLTVRDNGTGIEDLESLFEPFYTTKAPGDGVGLGLAISSGIVADLGGRLTARNALGRGAVFEMQLPLDGAQRTAAE